MQLPIEVFILWLMCHVIWRKNHHWRKWKLIERRPKIIKHLSRQGNFLTLSNLKVEWKMPSFSQILKISMETLISITYSDPLLLSNKGMAFSFLMRVNESESKEDALKFIIKISHLLAHSRHKSEGWWDALSLPIKLRESPHWLNPLIKVRAEEMTSHFSLNCGKALTGPLPSCKWRFNGSPLTSYQVEGKPSRTHSPNKCEGWRNALSLIIKLRENRHWLTPLIKVRVKELKGCTLISHQREGRLSNYASIFQSEGWGKTFMSSYLHWKGPHFISQSMERPFFISRN